LDYWKRGGVEWARLVINRFSEEFINPFGKISLDRKNLALSKIDIPPFFLNIPPSIDHGCTFLYNILQLDTIVADFIKDLFSQP
jgi:hypothetical protein